MTKEQHVHMLRRHTYNTGNAVYFCALPDCKFKIVTSLALGKRTICWRCGESFIMNEYSIRLAKPHCEKCHKPKSPTLSREDRARENLIRDFEKQPLVKEATSGGSIEDMRRRLGGLIHGNLAGKPDSEEDI